MSCVVTTASSVSETSRKLTFVAVDERAVPRALAEVEPTQTRLGYSMTKVNNAY